MTPALRSRLEAERMFTVADLAEFVGVACHRTVWQNLEPTQWGEAWESVAAIKNELEKEALAKVQAHLSSDTSSIRAKR